MVTLLQPAQALFDPAGAIPSAITARRWVLPLLAVVFATCFAGAAFAVRYDPAPSVVRRLTESNELKNTTEKELSDSIRTAGRIKLVSGVAKGLFAVPLFVLLFAVAVKVACWLIGRSIAFGEAFTAAAIAQLPIALFQILYGAVALSSATLGDGHTRTLLPSHLGDFLRDLSPQWARVASVADIFNLWAVVLLGFGISAGAGLSRFKGVAFALFLYVLWAGVFLIGLPGMSTGAGGPR